MSSRRRFLKILGGGTILAATAGAGFVATRTPTRALAPWQPNAYDDPRMAALSYALLAPNPHNRQPWLVELIGDDGVIIHRDTERELPHTDPHHRQLFIGLGAFIETMVLAASAQGYAVNLTLLPQGDDGPVASATFSKGASADPLAKHILHRHSSKDPYSDQRLSDEQVGQLQNYATLVLDEPQVQAIRDLTQRAFDIEVHTPRTLKESVDLMRIGKAEINANPDGIEMSDPFLEILRHLGMLTADVLMDTAHPANQAHLREYHTMLDATPHYAVLTTERNTRQDQLAVGRQLMRLYLKATEMGVGVHPVSQALQEYPEMQAEYQLAHELLAPEGHTVQMLLRTGFGPDPIATPRWPLETRILEDT
jgi:nitroreductase